MSNRFSEVVNVYAPLKNKIVRSTYDVEKPNFQTSISDVINSRYDLRNDAPFVDKQLRKAIYTRTQFKNNIE